MDVVPYASPVCLKGLVFMDTPGYDPVSITGMVAGGANMICFTTGRGSVLGCKPVPVIKIASNTKMFDHMQGDMDINAGRVVDGEVTIQEMGRSIYEMIIDTASGRSTKSEMQGIGDFEFVPWKIGAVL
jgi:altronate hydrolase